MKPMRQLARRLRFLFRRTEVEREMAEEMAFHLEMRAAEHSEDGLAPADARSAAQRKFGNVGVMQGRCRDHYGSLWVDQLFQDVRYAARTLRRNIGFTSVALITLALSIGVNTTAFTVLNRLLLRPMPFADIRRLACVVTRGKDGGSGAVSSGDYVDIRDQNTVFSQVAAYYGNWLSSLAEPGQSAIQCDSIDVTADYFAVMGIQPVMLGRGFTDADEAHHDPVVLISHAFWVRHYGADPKVIGRPLRTDGGKELTIIGVMVPSLDDPTLFSGTTQGIAFCALMGSMDSSYRERGWLTVIGRLKPGVSSTEAQNQMAVLGHRLEHDYPKTNTGRSLGIDPYPQNTFDATGNRLIWLVMAFSCMVLLVACVNLANLQLVRVTGRRPEFGVRLALGSSRGRLMRMLLTESILVSLVGGALGLALAQWSNQFLAAYWKVEMPLNLRVIGFAFVAAAGAGALFGTVPALIACRASGNSAMKAAARGSTPDRGRHRLRQVLIVVELAMALILLSGAGYFVRGIERIMHRDLGWNSNHVLIAYLALDHEHYGEFRDPRALAFSDRLLPELARLPGVEAAALSNDTVFTANLVNFSVEGRPPLGNDVHASIETPSPGYFGAFGIPLLEGRDFAATDRPGSPFVAIISKAMADRFWPGQSALGKRIGSGGPGDQDWVEIVGVVGNILHQREWNGDGNRLAIYFPWSQNAFRYMAITLRTSGNPEEMKEALRKAIGAIEPNIALSYVETADQTIAIDLVQYTLARRMLVQVAALGLFLAAVGLYGVIANLASERTREIGIRMALGAQPRDVVMMFLGGGMRLAVIGTLAGLLGALGLTKLLTHLVADFPGSEPWVTAGVALLLFAVAAAACVLPAIAATRINPTRALRSE